MNQLFKLNNDELENSLGFHIQNERKTLHIILEHINEVARRDLHLERGFGTLKDYLVKHFRYSERTAYRRIDGAKLLKQVPTLAADIQTGKMNVDKISEIVRAVKEKEASTGEKVSTLKKTELVALISGKTVAESQKDLAKALDVKVKEHEIKRIQQDDSVRVELSIPRKAYDKFIRCQEHASHKIQQTHGSQSMAAALEVIWDFYLVENKLVDATSGETTEKIENLDPDLKHHHERKIPALTKTNKTITPKTRREIFARDKCCQYKDPKTGRVCESKVFGQIDHKTSQWANGNHAPINLQVLCANHNRFKYRKESQLRWL
jgi:hypothetical protein